jgi:putative ABC transport system permease protein
VIRLGLTSLRSRTSASFACFLSVFLGTLMIGAFATQLQTALGEVSSADRETLVTIGAVVGGWGLVIVFFSVASMVGLTVRQRAGEASLLRAVGATPRQTRRLIVVESTSVSAVAALLAAGPAWLAGVGVLELLRNAEMVSDSTTLAAGGAAIGLTWLAMVLLSGLAAAVATRRAAKATVRAAQREGATGPVRISRWRTGAGIALIVVGLNYSILTVTMMANTEDPLAPMSTAGPACVFVSIGLATLAPTVLRLAAAAAGRPLARFGAAGHLAAHDVRARSHQLGGVLAPVIVLVGMGTGTIYLVAIENLASGAATSPEGRSVELLNYVVAGMISVFAAIMIVNTLAAAISARRREFGQQRLAGATPAQVRTAMLLEGGFVAVTGIVVGAVASLFTVLPYSWVKLDRLVPDLGVGYFAGVASVALVVTLLAGAVLTRRALRPSAVAAVALGTT